MQYANSNTRTIVINKTLSDTYKLLAMNFLFSGVMAFIGIVVNMPMMSIIASFAALGYLWFGMRNIEPSAKGIMATFIFTGLFGFGIGPTIGFYLALSGGPAIVMQALVGTAVIFATLSIYTIVSKKDFSFLAGFIFAGVIIGLVGMVASWFLGIPAFSLAISGIFALISAALILFSTSRVVRSGETNYVLITINLFVSLANIFMFLLHMFGISSND